MNFLFFTGIVVCTVVLPCALALVSLPQNDGRGM